jgi:hypothetical protein
MIRRFLAGLAAGGTELVGFTPNGRPWAVMPACCYRDYVSWFAGWHCPASRPRRGATDGLRSPGR